MLYTRRGVKRVCLTLRMETLWCVWHSERETCLVYWCTTYSLTVIFISIFIYIVENQNRFGFGFSWVTFKDVWMYPSWDLAGPESCHNIYCFLVNFFRENELWIRSYEPRLWNKHRSWPSAPVLRFVQNYIYVCVCTGMYIFLFEFLYEVDLLNRFEM